MYTSCGKREREQYEERRVNVYYRLWEGRVKGECGMKE